MVMSIPPTMPLKKDALPAMYFRMMGTWEGRFVVIDPVLGTIRDGGSKCVIENTAKGAHYAQRNTYTNDDGSTAKRELFGLYRNGTLSIDSKEVKGSIAFLDENTSVLNAFSKQGDVQFAETVRILKDDRRTRTWHVYTGNQCTKIIHSEERRVSEESNYFENEDNLQLNFTETADKENKKLTSIQLH